MALVALRAGWVEFERRPDFVPASVFDDVDEADATPTDVEGAGSTGVTSVTTVAVDVAVLAAAPASVFVGSGDVAVDDCGAEPDGSFIERRTAKIPRSAMPIATPEDKAINIPRLDFGRDRAVGGSDETGDVVTPMPIGSDR